MFDQEDGTNLRVAFLIQAHSDPDHLGRLTNALRGHDIFIHWDAKSGSAPVIPDVTFTDERVSVFWAGFTQVSATMAMVRTALETGHKYSKLVLISGSCYPIKPLSELLGMFADDGGRNYINAVRVAESEHLTKLVRKRMWRDAVLPKQLSRNGMVGKVERWLRAALNVAISWVPKRKPYNDLYHGSNWWALTPDAARHALTVYEQNTNIRRYYSFTFASDEQFFQTVLRNSEFAESCGPVLPYTGRGTYKTANLHLIDKSLTKWFDINDFELIRNSDKFFVRKLRSPQSTSLVDLIDAKILKGTISI